MTKTERLKQAYADLKSGKIIEFITDEDKRHTKDGCKCWIRESANNPNKHYIYWQHFGNSANDMSLQSLRWIAKTIAKCSTYEYKIVNSVW
jgi:hypothetical protein